MAKYLAKQPVNPTHANALYGNGFLSNIISYLTGLRRRQNAPTMTPSQLTQILNQPTQIVANPVLESTLYDPRLVR